MPPVPLYKGTGREEKGMSTIRSEFWLMLETGVLWSVTSSALRRPPLKGRWPLEHPLFGEERIADFAWWERNQSRVHSETLPEASHGDEVRF